MSEASERRGARAEAAPNVHFDPMTGARNLEEALRMAPDAISMRELLKLQAYFRANPTSLLAKEAEEKILFGKAVDSDGAPALNGLGSSRVYSRLVDREWNSFDRMVRKISSS